MIEAIGYLAAIVTFSGFLVNNLITVRAFSLIACLVWLTYGILIGSGSVILCNTIIGGLQIYKLYFHYVKKINDEVSELNVYKIKLEAEFLDGGDGSLDEEWFRINKRLNKLRKSFFY